MEKIHRKGLRGQTSKPPTVDETKVETAETKTEIAEAKAETKVETAKTKIETEAEVAETAMVSTNKQLQEN